MACCSQCSGIAMGQYPVAIVEKRGTVLAHRPVDPDIFRQYVMRFLKQDSRQIGQWFAAVFRPEFFHLVECPEKIDCGRPAGSQSDKTVIHLFGKPGGRFSRKSGCFQCDSVGSCDTDGRCASDDHGPDGVGNASGGIACDIFLSYRQQPLVDHFDLSAIPAQCFDLFRFVHGFILHRKRKERKSDIRFSGDVHYHPVPADRQGKRIRQLRRHISGSA